MTTHTHEPTQADWDTIAAGYDRFVTPTHHWLAEQGLRAAGLRNGERFLDVAAGSGALSIPAARLGARVTAVDQSREMLTRLESRSRIERLAIETRVMDGHALEFEDDVFDVAGSQFGVMLFTDMPKGIREIARVTKPGGRVLMSVYGAPQKVEFFHLFVSAIQTVVPEFTGPPMDPPPLPFQLQDPARLRQELIDAGLTSVRVETITEPLEFATGEELWNWLLNSNPIVRSIFAELALTATHVDQVRLALDPLIRARVGVNGHAVLTNPINIGVGTKPTRPGGVVRTGSGRDVGV